MSRLADDILAAERARVTARREQEAGHADRRRRVVDALCGAAAPDADPGPVTAFGQAIDAHPATLGEVLRDVLGREGGS